MNSESRLGDLVERVQTLDLVYDELVELVEHLFPVCEVGEDQSGQIVIRTGLRGRHGIEVIEGDRR